MKKSVGVQTASLAEGIRSGDPRAIARAISALEDREEGVDRLVQEIFPDTGNALLVGLTGAPGTGKSSLANGLARQYREQGRRVGILAVDPTSPFTGGALLGDRIRMQQHATDRDIFIRSMATRGTLGGLARATGDAALVLDAAGKDVVIIETVGVGQDEVDIVRLADVTLLLLVPGMGDDVQNFKAGVMEIADVFILNKADRGGTDRLENEIKVLLSMSQRADQWTPPIVRTVATDNQGLPELAAALSDYAAHLERIGLREEKKVQRWQERLLELIRERALERVLQTGVGQERLWDYARRVARRELDPYSVVEEWLGAAGIGR